MLLKKWKKLCVISFALNIMTGITGLSETFLHDFQVVAIVIWLRLRYETRNVSLLPCVHLHRSINSFHEEECWRLFRFRNNDLYRLLRNLRIPAYIALSNGSNVGGEEALLSCLRKFASVSTLQDLTYIFGREWSTWSRVFSWFLLFICEKFGDLMFDNLAYWEPMFYKFSEAIRLKLVQYGLHYPEGEFLVCSFIDDHCFESCRPGGPNGSGAGQIRAPTLLQRAFYNGWKSMHGLKWQTVDAPNGMTMDMWGPKSLRHSDLNLLEWSSVCARILHTQEEAGRENLRVAYGDGIFPWHQCLRSKHKGPNLTEVERAENMNMCKVRISVEWHYGEVAELFPFTDYKKNVKLRHMNSSCLYFVAAFLRNCHTCLYGNNTSHYFNCSPPSLESYLNQNNN